MRLPDFIVIGAMKAATSTLHEQLSKQPGVFMSTPKEPNFFSDDDVYSRGLEWYASLFEGADEHALCGESSTHYTKLPTHPRTAERLARALPEAKLIYVIRHPIDRLLSHYVHAWTQREISGSIELAVRRHPELVDYGRYWMQLQPYLKRFGRDRVLLVAQPRLRTRPRAELERICSWLGVEGPVRWHDDSARQNVSSHRMRRSPIRDALVYAPGLSWARRTLVPPVVRDRVKRLWQMRRGPELSERLRGELVEVFDQDLAMLGEHLGAPLSCHRFDELTREAPLEWTNQATGVRESAA